MHVKRHLNRLFGSFRTSVKKQRPFVGAAGQSQWELVDHEAEVSQKAEIDSAHQEIHLNREFHLRGNLRESDLDIDPKTNAGTERGVKKASLLKRTWSSRRRKEGHNLDCDTGTRVIQFDEGLGSVVDEINATIGLMNEYSRQPNFGTTNTENSEFCQIHDSSVSTLMDSRITKLNTSQCQGPEDFEPCWDIFDDKVVNQLITPTVANPSIDVETKAFIQALEVNVVASCSEADKQYADLKDARIISHTVLQKQSNSKLRRSGRRIYNTLRRKNQSTEDKENEDNIHQHQINFNFHSNSDNWMIRSFRKVVRRKNNQIEFSPVTDDKGKNYDNQVSVVNKGIGRRFKDGMASIGRSFMASSGVMPLPLSTELPYSPDSTYPQVYYEDEDAIYEFRRYCNAQEWDRVQQQRRHQVGYCP